VTRKKGSRELGDSALEQEALSWFAFGLAGFTGEIPVGVSWRVSCPVAEDAGLE
jgi:hypothetical protein